jgi:hypothetical protein
VKSSLIYLLLIPIFIWGCSGTGTPVVQVQKKNLYDVIPETNPQEINGFREITIFSDSYDNTIWVSPEKQCVTLKRVNEVFCEGQAALHVRWDKVTGGCKWIGIGFGWNNWLPKDMSDILNVAAVTMRVKSVKGTFSNFPVAFAFEDYTGVQSYYGFTPKLASGLFTDTTWTRVTIPLALFPFQSNEADPGKMKQFIIQLEGDGDIYLDDIRLIRL